MKKIIALINVVFIITSFVCVSADFKSTKLDALICVVHDDGKSDSMVSTSAQGIISNGSVGYTRQKITVFDLDKLVIPEGYVLDSAIYSIYCITNYELVPSSVGMYELKADDFDFETTQLTMDNIPARGNLITKFDLPGRVNGETYNAYMTFDLSDYFKKSIAANKRYIALSALQTARCTKGGMTISTKYGDYPPTLTLTWREPALVAEKHSVSIGEAEMNELLDAEMTYFVDLYNETAEEKNVRLILAEVCDNYCESVSVSEKVTIGAGLRETLSLNKTAASTSNKMRLFVVEDTGIIMRPIISERYELTESGWQ